MVAIPAHKQDPAMVSIIPRRIVKFGRDGRTGFACSDREGPGAEG
jgi:hypothetical protein